MNKAERVVAALKGNIPDKVPFLFNTMMVGVQEQIVGHKITEPTYNGMNNAGWVGSPDEKGEVTPALTVTPETAGILGLDSIQIQVLPPIYAGHSIQRGLLCMTNGLIDSGEAFEKIEMPDPDDEAPLRSIEEMIKQYKGDFAMGARIRLGVSPSLNSMGIENVSMFYADEDDTLLRTVEMYTDWSRRMNKNLSEMDFDFFWCFDDVAFSSSMLISPDMFREVFKENLIKAASTITKPWIFHSDGNYQLVLDDVVDLGASAIHPIERASMDTKWLKESYGSKLCLVGNIDIQTLSTGTPEDVEQEVKACIDLLGPGGRYMISDSNSIPDGCLPENLIAAAKAVEKYRYIY